MAKLQHMYIIKFRAANGENATTVRYHLPKTGSLWMMEECEIIEVTRTGREWVYDRASRKLFKKETTK